MAFKNLSFRSKITSMVALMSLITFAGAGITYWNNGELQKRYRQMIEKNDYLEITISNISDQLHIMSRQELLFALKGDTAAIDVIASVSTNLDLFVAELEAIEATFLAPKAVETFKADIYKYKAVSNEYIDSVKQQIATTNSLVTQLLNHSTQISNAMAAGYGSEMKALTDDHKLFTDSLSRFISAREHAVFSELVAITQKFKADAGKGRNASNRALLKEIDAALETFTSIEEQLAKIADVEKRQKNLLVSLETQTQEITSQVRVFNENEIKQLGVMEKYSLLVSIVSVGAVLVIVLLAVFMILRMAQTLMAISDGVRHSSVETKGASRSLQVAAQKVSSATIDQASAIQETVATLNQISAMVSKSVESANISSERAHSSLRIANEGRASVNQMQKAMTEIQDNIGALGLQVGNSNKEFEGIVTIINEIVNKTQVIHDIVFQTKLLSFNASVEAARAGEHGKGFAVVAEEVGNLAQMSGQAAREINELLSKSRGNVEQIVKDSKTQMERLVQHGSERVKNGANLANRCEEILGQVVENVDSVTSFMEQIVNASKEQAEGVNNITIAMTEIDTSTHINSTLAHETMGHSTHLAEQANELETTVLQLDSMIRGESAALSRSASQASEISKTKDAERPSPKDLSQKRQASAGKKAKPSPPPVNDMPSADDPGFEDVA